MERQNAIHNVYVCAPYRVSVNMDVEQRRLYERDVKTARMACRFLSKLGYMPLAPQLYFYRFLGSCDEKEQEDEMILAMEWLDHADEMWVFGPVLTDGMVFELTAARKRGIPVRQLNLQNPGDTLEPLVREM